MDTNMATVSRLSDALLGLERKLNVIQEVSRLTISTDDPVSLLERITDLVTNVFEVEAASLCLLDEATNEIKFVVTRGERAEFVKQLRLQLGQGLVGWTVASGEGLIVPDVGRDPRFYPGIDRLSGFETRSVMCAPLRIHDKPLGAFEIINKRTGRLFSPGDLELLTATANQAALLLENANLHTRHQKKIEQLSAFLEIQRESDVTAGVDGVLSKILETATRISNAEASSVLLVDPDAHELYFRVATGEKAEDVKKFRLGLGEGVAGWVALRAAPLLVPDVETEPRFKRDISEKIGFKTRSLLAVPMMVRGEVVGVLEFVNLPERIPSEDQYVEVLSGFASEAARAIERAQLYERLESKVELANEGLRKANADLAVEKRKVEAIIASMGEGIVVTDSEEQITLFNPRAETMCEVSQSQCLGKKLAEVVRCPELVALVRQAPGCSEDFLAAEIQVEREGEPRFFSAHVAAVRDLDGSLLGVVSVLSDITSLKEMDAMKSELLSIVSHELRSPLTSIKGVAATLLRGAQLDGQTEHQFLQIINEQCDRLTRMISRLLDVARIESGRALDMVWSTVDLRALAEKVFGTQKVYAMNHRFETQVPDEVRMVRADADKLEQILTNLVNNATKYSEGGTIRVAAKDWDENIAVVVSDEGRGIPSEQIPRLFQRFHRGADRSRKELPSTGLGLYIVKHLVEAHGGTITVTSQEGAGSSFLFTLPKAPAQ